MSKSMPGISPILLQVPAQFSSTPESIMDSGGNTSPLELSTENVIVNGGNLGILGSTTTATVFPFYPLHVAENQIVRIEANTTGGTSNTDGVMLGLGAPGIFSVDAEGKAAGRFTVTNNGNVGINQPNPQYKLDVSGTMNVTEQFANPGMPQSSTAPDPATLVTVLVDVKTGILYYQNQQ